ncbi:MAG: ImmA/IrrE family metallo-endopeptidase [Sphingorhabdus sp.]
MQAVASKLDRPRVGMVTQEADRLSAPFSVPPIPVIDIAENSGVDVVFADFGNAGGQVAGFCDFKSAKLYVNANDATNRQTFTIAHELGHWILHRDYFERHPDDYSILPRLQSVLRSDPFEQEANDFAAKLLVPRRLILPVKDAPVAELARIFAVSRMMMEIRLKNV